MSHQHEDRTPVPGSAEDNRREALGKLGRYGAVTGLALLGMMTATKAPAASFADGARDDGTRLA
jgi:hypothetical protein